MEYNKKIFNCSINSDKHYFNLYKRKHNNKIIYTLNISDSIYEEFPKLDDAINFMFEEYGYLIDDWFNDNKNYDWFDRCFTTQAKKIPKKIIAKAKENYILFVKSDHDDIKNEYGKYIFVITTDIYKKYKDIMKLDIVK